MGTTRKQSKIHQKLQRYHEGDEVRGIGSQHQEVFVVIIHHSHTCGPLVKGPRRHQDRYLCHRQRSHLFSFGE